MIYLIFSSFFHIVNPVTEETVTGPGTGVPGASCSVWVLDSVRKDFT